MGKYNSGYRPRWSKDEVLAFFYLNLSKKTAQRLGEALGYELVGEWSENIFRFKTPMGKAGEACGQFESFDELVEWAEPVDLKLEFRGKNLEGIVKMMRDVDYAVSNKRYKEQIDKVVKQLYKVK
jgi:hypothetical protein